MPVFETPRTRRLRTELKEMRKLAEESSIMSFEASPADAPEKYLVTFKGPGLLKGGAIQSLHKVELNLGSEYPRQAPYARFKTPVLHPNISTDGTPCLGMFTWSPNVRLTELVEILWDMIRMANYNPHSAFHHEAWNKFRDELGFPLDPRVLRDRSPRPPPQLEEGEDIFFIGDAREWRPRRTIQQPEALKEEVEDWLKRRDLWYDTEVYTEREWADRQEPYGHDATVTITTEGPLYEIVNDPSPTHERLLSDFSDFLRSLGYWWEPGYAWSIHLYPL